MAHAQSLLDIRPTSTGMREGKEAALFPFSSVPPLSFFPLSGSIGQASRTGRTAGRRGGTREGGLALKTV